LSAVMQYGRLSLQQLGFLLGTRVQLLAIFTGQGPDLSGWTTCSVWAMRHL